jgi:alpha-D-ribose 1-methylphosphonate 5-triphosphate synthase subunit PhnH
MKKLHDFDEVFDAQLAFRLILDAMANPTRKVNLGPCAAKFHAGEKPMLAIGMTLLDNEVSFHVMDDRELESELMSLTLSRRDAPDTADFLFVRSQADIAAAVSQAKCGTPRDPHQSATLVIRDDGCGAHPMCLYGPGIDGLVAFTASDAAYAAITARDAQCYAYPQGIDLLFVSGAGEVYAIPRLVLREVR